MYTKREWIIFFAGVQTFHTLSHLLISLNGILPINFFGITITQTFNTWAIIINAVITLWLLWWASKTSR